MNKTDHIRGPY